MNRVYITAEIGVNAGKDAGLAKRLVEAAAHAGADAVKFQFYNPELVTAVPEDRRMLADLRMDDKEWPGLRRAALDHGLDFYASVFDIPSVELACAVGMDKIKLGSGEITNFILIDYLGLHKKKPVWLSTGFADDKEIQNVLLRLGSSAAALYHCVPLYPCPPAKMNLSRIKELCLRFPCHQIGYSDHTARSMSARDAVLAGAQLIEVHLTDDVLRPGPDHASSLNPDDFTAMCLGVRQAERFLSGNPTKEERINVIKKIRRGSLENLRGTKRVLDEAPELLGTFGPAWLKDIPDYEKGYYT